MPDTSENQIVPVENSSRQEKTIDTTYTVIKKSPLKTVLKLFLLILLSFFVLGLFYIGICQVTAETMQYDFLTIWFRGLLLITIIGSLRLYRVKVDENNDTGYRKGFTPTKAMLSCLNFFIVSFCMFFSGFFYSYLGIIETNINKQSIINIISYINNKTGDKNEIQTNDSNDISPERLRYRD